MECFVIFVMAWCWLNATESKPHNVIANAKKNVEKETMEIEIKRIITNEFQNGNFDIINLNSLEEYLNKSFENRNYGESVIKYFFGFELYKFDGGFANFFSNEIESWKIKSKWFVTNSHFDWNVFINLNEKEIFEIIKTEFLKSVDRIENMKRKPKNFDYLLFRKDLEEVLNNYK